jgi:hypothetical protein
MRNATFDLLAGAYSSFFYEIKIRNKRQAQACEAEYLSIVALFGELFKTTDGGSSH